MAEKLDAAWNGVSNSCPRACATRLGEARERALAEPRNTVALEEYRRLLDERPELISARHARAHAAFNAGAFRLAPLAVVALQNLKAAILRRAEKVRTLWASIAAEFPGSFDDLAINEHITGRVENSIRQVDEQISALANPAGNCAHVVLDDLMQIKIATETRQTAGSDYHEPPVPVVDGGALELVR
ncbi:MAG: hypothetical protein ABMA13_01195 [Chthoniobacteraceae bacterium]